MPHRIISALFVVLSLSSSACDTPAVTPVEPVDMAMPAAPVGCDGGWEVCGCKTDVDCPAGSPRCDLNSARCVPCLPLHDNCPAGSRCNATNTSYVCVATCNSADECGPSDGGVAKASCCAGSCTDPASDPFNCGACAHACPPLVNATAGCHSNVCGLGSCLPGFADCNKMDVDGCEINKLSDAQNCGGCGVVCGPYQHGINPCIGGACTKACTMGYLDCNGDFSDGCEIDGQQDTNNCGSCAAVCPQVPNAAPGCKAGACAVAYCVQSFGDCNMVFADGCETSLSTDVNNCGLCGVACQMPFATPQCRGGGCAVKSCQAGHADCNQFNVDGCEIDTNSDISNCGGCGRPCHVANGAPACGGGVCSVASCIAGWADCNQLLIDGCEDAIAHDVKNCGACGVACPAVANGSKACSGGVCGIAACNQGWDDCNKDASDGCEASLGDVKSCAMCGIVCMPLPNSSPGCNMGVCGIGKCDALYGDCDRVQNNGCEKSLATDVMNCGACGKLCAFPNAAPACLAGICGIFACNVGWGDCDQNQNNGCEASIGKDPKNCGGCGVVCPNNTPYCAGGTCFAKTSVLLCVADYNGAAVNVANQLNLDNAFTLVDTFDCGSATPTLQKLQTYNAVFVFGSYGFADRVALGNNLASYVDGGGGVVEGFWLFNLNEDPIGRWATGKYACINTGNWNYGDNFKPKPNDAASLLVSNVSSLYGSYLGTGGLANGAISVWDYNGGQPGIATCAPGGHKRVDLNFPPVGGNWSGDGYQLMKNAIIYVSH